jgi:IS30 family transposase
VDIAPNKRSVCLKDDEAWRIKPCKVTEAVKELIEILLRQELSPQQVVDYLKRHRKVMLHHETIYQLIYADKVQGGDFYTYFQITSMPFRKRYGNYDRRSRIADWEGDTVKDQGRRSALLTLVERKTLYAELPAELANRHKN